MFVFNALLADLLRFQPNPGLKTLSFLMGITPIDFLDWSISKSMLSIFSKEAKHF